MLYEFVDEFLYFCGVENLLPRGACGVYAEKRFLSIRLFFFLKTFYNKEYETRNFQKIRFGQNSIA